MKRLYFTILTCALSAVIFFSSSTTLFAQEIDPQARKLFIGQNKPSIQTYISETGDIPDGFMLYTSVHRMEGIGGPVDSGAGDQDLDYFASRYRDKDFQVGLYMVGVLRDIPLGRYNNKLKILADWLSRVPNHVYLRIGYEFDGPHNQYEPEPYQAAYRHIVDYLKKRGIVNVSYVWHSYAGAVTRDRMDWYPGDDYVDWVGLSYFDSHNGSNLDAVAELSKTLNKPLMIAEATPRGRSLSQDDGAWDGWFVMLFDFMDRHNVSILSYINTNWESAPMFRGRGWGDSRIESNQTLMQKWLHHIEAYKMRSEPGL